VQGLATNNKITPEIIASLKSVSEVALSPDGKWIAYTVRSPRDEGDAPGGSRYRIWLVDADGKNLRALTAKEYNSQSVHWFSNSRRIAFLSRRGEGSKQQVYAMAIDGGEAEALTSEKEGVGSAKFSPDEKLIAFTRQDAETAEEKENKKLGKDWRVVGADFKYTRLHIHDLQAGQDPLLPDNQIPFGLLVLEDQGPCGHIPGADVLFQSGGDNA